MTPEMFTLRYMSLMMLMAFGASLTTAFSELDAARDPGSMIIAIICYCLAAVIISVPPWEGKQLSLLPTLLAVLFFLICVERTYSVVPVLPVAGQMPWFIFSYILMLLALCVRLRFGWAVFVMVLVTLMSVSRWTVVRGELVATESYTVVGVSVIFAMWLLYREFSLFARRKREIRRLLLHARSSDEAEQDVRNAAYQRVQEVRRLAGGLLERIAHDPAEVTAYDINQFRLTEAQLRDTIRGRSIATPYILEVTRTARDRGVVVDILDERGKLLPPDVMNATTEQVSEVLNNALSGTVTIRAFPEGDPTAVFIVHDAAGDDDDPVAIEIADVTGEVSRF